MAIQIFSGPDDVLYLDLLPGKEEGEVTLVSCNANGECIQPLITIKEESAASLSATFETVANVAGEPKPVKKVFLFKE